MNVIDENDLRNYFQLYKDYRAAEEPAVITKLDKKLSQYKDRFHTDSETVLKLLSDKKSDFVDEYEDAYKDLVFDLEMHAKTMEEIRQTHTYDPDQQMWVPKGRSGKGR
jgi:hypothetical protein